MGEQYYLYSINRGWLTPSGLTSELKDALLFTREEAVARIQRGLSHVKEPVLIPVSKSVLDEALA